MCTNLKYATKIRLFLRISIRFLRIIKFFPILQSGIIMYCRFHNTRFMYAFHSSISTIWWVIAYLTFQLYFSSRVFNKVKSRSAHMKSHRPIPLPDSTGQESKRPAQQSTKAQQLQQSMPLQQSQQQQQQTDNAMPQIQDHHQQQLPASISDNSVQNTAHLCRNPTRPP